MNADEGFCVRCKVGVKIEAPEEVSMKNGRKAIRGKCPKCGTTIYRIKPVKLKGVW